jgi:hypothetical protein
VVWPGHRDDAVFIGSIMPIGGPFGTAAQPLENSVRLAVEDFNAVTALQGGRQIPRVRCEDGQGIDAAIARAEHLVSAVAAAAIIGPTTNEHVLATAGVTVSAGTFSITPTASAMSIADLDDDQLVWRTIPGDVYQSSALVDRFRDLDSADGVGNLLMLAKDDAYGNGILSAIISDLESDLPSVTQATYAHPATFASQEELQSAYEAVLTDVSGDGPFTHVLFIGTSENQVLLYSYLFQVGGPAFDEPMPLFTVTHGAVPEARAGIAAGMPRLVDAGRPFISFSGSDLSFIVDARNALSTGDGSVDLQGVSGELQWDIATGDIRADVWGWDVLDPSMPPDGSMPTAAPTRIYCLGPARHASISRIHRIAHPAPIHVVAAPILEDDRAARTSLVGCCEHAVDADLEPASNQHQHARELLRPQPQPPTELALHGLGERAPGVIDPARDGRVVHPVHAADLAHGEPVDHRLTQQRALPWREAGGRGGKRLAEDLLVGPLEVVELGVAQSLGERPEIVIVDLDRGALATSCVECGARRGHPQPRGQGSAARVAGDGAHAVADEQVVTDDLPQLVALGAIELDPRERLLDGVGEDRLQRGDGRGHPLRARAGDPQVAAAQSRQLEPRILGVLESTRDPGGEELRGQRHRRPCRSCAAEPRVDGVAIGGAAAARGLRQRRQQQLDRAHRGTPPPLDWPSSLARRAAAVSSPSSSAAW